MNCNLIITRLNMTAFNEEHDDDKPVGRVITRRQAFKLFSAPALLYLAGCSSMGDETTDEPLTGSCIARPELTEGPYYVDENLNRSDIRSDTGSGEVKAGALLSLTFNVSRVVSGGCAPLENALVDVWHADALGNYSDVVDQVGLDYLRGYQITGADSVAQFTTIYPGWYPGRAVHIHFKVRSSDSSGSTYEFTSQLFFQDDFTNQVYRKPPITSEAYATR